MTHFRPLLFFMPRKVEGVGDGKRILGRRRMEERCKLRFKRPRSPSYMKIIDPSMGGSTKRKLKSQKNTQQSNVEQYSANQHR